MKHPTLAVILGGGRGTRLHPLTGHRSKPAVPIAGKYRLVDIPISNCINSDIRKIFVLTQFNSASLNRHIKNTYNFDSFSSGFVDILAAEQTLGSTDWFQGTADAVRQSIHHLENHEYEQVLILSGDQLYQMDFRHMLSQHKDSGADITIATIPVNAEDATGFGIMKKDDKNRIDSFVEKPSLEELSSWKSPVDDHLKGEGKEYLASMGIYIFNRDRLMDLMDTHADATDFGKEIIPKALHGETKVFSYEFTGYWTDIGTIRSFYEANLELSDAVPQFNLYDNRNPIYTRARLLPASKVSGTHIHQTVVSEGCIIEAESITRSVVGIRTRIGKETVIENTIIMGSDSFNTIEELSDQHPDRPPLGIGINCSISNAIIDKNARIGQNVTIHGSASLKDGDYGPYHVVDGIVIVVKGQSIMDGTTIQ
ncbi:MAG: glucose-1-phosphate adenylyltransferase [Rhodothermaeota bacterium MED-G64]|nr:MAG: glucose-1-phosphate adenylyltransferase [Rhodothermaeota bacterium MED-G64]